MNQVPPYEAVFQDPRDPGRIEPEDQEAPPLGLQATRAASEADEDHVQILRHKAHEAAERGDLARALALLSEAVTVGTDLSLMYTRRAEVLLKLRRPIAAVRDADEALKVNPNLGRAYRVRGLAYRGLQRWPEAHADLAQAQMIDYDETVEPEHRHVDQVFAKIKNLETIYKAHPDLLNDPKILQATMEINENPAAYMKYQSDPEIGPVLKKVMDTLGVSSGA
jgi:suppressor of tumorigenicity protein 13